MELKDIRAIYFVGIGGIGMSALARYFVRQGSVVAGYDRTPSELTRQLEREGMLIHYTDSPDEIPYACKKPVQCLVVYTPAIPADHKELAYFRQNGFTVVKRAELLGTLTRSHKGLCVAGTHGKTTTSTMCAHIMHQSHVDCNAFLGGISKNYGSNYILSSMSDYVVIEADEFDRSFHQLRPWISVVTATDPDHLDIYGTKEAYLEGFRHYTTLIQPGGALIIHTGLELRPAVAEGVKTYTYGLDEGDFHAENVRIEGGTIRFDMVSPIESVRNIELGQPIAINIENGLAAMAVAQLCGCDAEELRYGMFSYKGVDRRFDFRLRSRSHVVISDYAHHPNEIRMSAKSLKQLYPDRKVTALFQPHLYTRTRDFYADFAAALSLFDEVILTDIYPARELPIEGVSSRLIFDRLESSLKEKSMVPIEGVIDMVKGRDFDVLVVLGAGDLDNLVPQICKIVEAKEAE